MKLLKDACQPGFRDSLSVEGIYSLRRQIPPHVRATNPAEGAVGFLHGALSGEETLLHCNPLAVNLLRPGREGFFKRVHTWGVEITLGLSTKKAVC
jgi:hypothetical protein